MNGSFTGMIGMLDRNEVDVAVTDFEYRLNRSFGGDYLKVFDTSRQYQNNSYHMSTY